MGFRVQGAGFGVQGSGFRVQSLGFRSQGYLSARCRIRAVREVHAARKPLADPLYVFLLAQAIGVQDAGFRDLREGGILHGA